MIRAPCAGRPATSRRWQWAGAHRWLGGVRWSVLAGFVAVLALPALLAGCGQQHGATGPVQATAVTRSEVGFRSVERLDDHYRKHGREFGRVSRDEYLRLAQTLRDRPGGGTILEAVRRDRVITRFDRDSGAFIAFDADGIIKTFFKPNDGERYFQRQARR